MINYRKEATINSALWAAYADALGFITELASSKGTLKTRAGLDFIKDTVPWKRKLDGIYGTQVQLPAGSYSDDTQLRLSTSRAINGSGYFDVEGFSKCELPVWLSYALGAGRGTKIATNNLIKKSVNWFSNFYSSKNSSYVFGGGNGAAMRIQPHVWSATDLYNIDTFLVDVIRNSIVTHGHPRAIAGAMFHSLSLARVLRGEKLTFESLREDAKTCASAPYFVAKDDMLETFWLHQWEAESGQSLQNAFSSVSEELLNDLDSAFDWLNSKALDYKMLVELLGLDEESQRGSGTKTSLAAALLLLKGYQLSDSSDLVQHVVNELKTDTDTIATMYGALLGASTNVPPYGLVQDVDYIVSEARRMYDISTGKRSKSFAYPDALSWSPNRSSLDNVTVFEGQLSIELFGKLVPLSPAFEGTKKDFLYKWYKTPQGFSILLKHRILENLPDNQMAVFPNSKVKSPYEGVASRSDSSVLADNQQSMSSNESAHQSQSKIIDMKALTKEAIESQFEDEIIGRHIKILANRKNYSIESVVAYASIIAHAMDMDGSSN